MSGAYSRLLRHVVSVWAKPGGGRRLRASLLVSCVYGLAVSGTLVWVGRCVAHNPSEGEVLLAVGAAYLFFAVVAYLSLGRIQPNCEEDLAREPLRIDSLLLLLGSVAAASTLAAGLACIFWGA